MLANVALRGDGLTKEQAVGAASDRDTAELQRELSARLAQQAAVAELGQFALRNPDSGELLDQALAVLCDVLDVELSKALHLVAPGEPLVLIAGRGWKDEVRIGETTVPSDYGSQAGYTLLQREPVIVEDLSTETRFSGPALLTSHWVVSGMSVVIPGPEAPYGVLAVHTRRRRAFGEHDADFLRSVANVIGAFVQSRQAREQIEHHLHTERRRARYQKALTQCAHALLRSSGSGRIEEALEALVTATEAKTVFLERNVHDEEFGFCTRSVARAGVRSDAAAAYWQLVPWDRLPSSRAHLERGEPFLIRPRELTGIERATYAGDPHPMKAELDLPIMVDGEWAGLIGFGDRVTEQEWTEEDISLLTTAAAMFGAFWEREAARDRLTHLVQSKDDFVAAVSHELRTPLTAVLGFAEELCSGFDTFDPTEIGELAQTIATESMELAHLVEDLLVAARVDMDRVRVDLGPVDVRREMESVRSLLGADVDIESAEDCILAWGDAFRVRQIIRNLLTNAKRYGGDTVQARIVARDGTVEVTVRDNGPGIPAASRERIFLPFQQAHGHPGRSGSIGLGLSVSKQLAQLMGADLAYAFTDGWSVFTLTLQAPPPPDGD
jgi:signal transduction histidine kinase